MCIYVYNIYIYIQYFFFLSSSYIKSNLDTFIFFPIRSEIKLSEMFSSDEKKTSSVVTDW